MVGVRPEGSRLTVLELYDTIKGHGNRYLCQCDCGKRVVVRSSSLRSGNTRSCGCIHDEALSKNVQKAYPIMFVEGTHIQRIKVKQPQENNTSGIRGVGWHRRLGKWQARITFKRKQYCLGTYSDINKAAEARREAEERLFGEFLEWYNSRGRGANN